MLDCQLKMSNKSSKLLSTQPYAHVDDVDNEDDEDNDDDYRPSEDEEAGLSLSEMLGSKLRSAHRIQLRSSFFSDLDPELSGDEIDAGPSADETCKEVTTAKVELSEEKKKRADELWAELCGSNKKCLQKATIALTTSSCSSLKDVKLNESVAHKKNDDKFCKVYDFAGDEVVVEKERITKKKTTESVDGLKVNNEPTSTQSRFAITVKRSTGLGSLVSNLTKKQKMSTLTKTKLDWDLFKKDEGIEDELRHHVKNKDSFVERQAFLQRTDLKQFEIEKNIRERSRLRDPK